MKKVFSVIIVAFAALFPWSFAAAEGIPCAKMETIRGGDFEYGGSKGAVYASCQEDNSIKVRYLATGTDRNGQPFTADKTYTTLYQGNGEVVLNLESGGTIELVFKKQKPFFGQPEDVLLVTHRGKGVNRATLKPITQEQLVAMFPHLASAGVTIASSQ